MNSGSKLDISAEKTKQNKQKSSFIPVKYAKEMEKPVQVYTAVRQGIGEVVMQIPPYACIMMLHV